LDCCAWQVPVAEASTGSLLRVYFGGGKYFEGNMDMVSGLHKFWSRYGKPADQHQARRGCGYTEQGRGLNNGVRPSMTDCFSFLVAPEPSLWIT